MGIAVRPYMSLTTITGGGVDNALISEMYFRGRANDSGDISLPTGSRTTGSKVYWNRDLL